MTSLPTAVFGKESIALLPPISLIGCHDSTLHGLRPSYMCSCCTLTVNSLSLVYSQVPSCWGKWLSMPTVAHVFNGNHLAADTVHFTNKISGKIIFSVADYMVHFH